MRVRFENEETFNNWRYNLCLVAPTKGEAKKTATLGLIRIQAGDWSCAEHPNVYTLEGAAMDDYLSISEEVFVAAVDEASDSPLWISPEKFRAVEYQAFGWVDIPADPAFSEYLDEVIWETNIIDSIYGQAKGVSLSGLKFNPDRLRKLSLLKPHSAIDWEFVEWADRTIIRWYAGQGAKGAYFPADVSQ